jgi:homoserine kinase type II
MAVYTHLSEDELRALVDDHYALGAYVAAEGIAQGVSNSNYRLKTAQGTYILTLYEKSTNPQDLPFFLGLMEHLAARGIACPRPVARCDGGFISEAGGKAAAIVSVLEGKDVSVPTQAQASSVGAALAKLHLAGQDFTGNRENGLGLRGWQGLYVGLQGRLDSIAPGLEALVAEEMDYLATHWPAALPCGIIHADLFPDNVFFMGDAVSGIIDFYYACNDALAYDLAITLTAWCFTADGNFAAEKAAAMLASYQQHRPLTAEEKAAMPVLLRGAAMRFLLTRARDWLNRSDGALVTPHDPREYQRRLEFYRNGGWKIA